MICEECNGESDDADENDFRLTGRGIDLYFCSVHCLTIWAVEQLADHMELTK